MTNRHTFAPSTNLPSRPPLPPRVRTLRARAALGAIVGLGTALAGCPEAAPTPDAGHTTGLIDAGVADAGAGDVNSPVVLNEVQTSGTDWIELHNPTDDEVSLTGLSLMDAADDGTPNTAVAFTFGPGRTLGPRGFAVILANDVPGTDPVTTCIEGVETCDTAGFKLSSSRGDTVFLRAGDVTLDSFAAPAGDTEAMTRARLPDGTGAWGEGSPTPGAANEAAMVAPDAGMMDAGMAMDAGRVDAGMAMDAGMTGDAGTPVQAAVVINELQASGTDWIELYNVSGSAQDLSGWSVTDTDDSTGMAEPNTADALVFPAGTQLAADGYLVVIADNTAVDGPTMACEGVVMGTCYSAGFKVSNGAGESVFLRDAAGITVDRLDYPGDATDSTQTWARTPNGTGAFAAAAPTPGAVNAD